MDEIRIDETNHLGAFYFEEVTFQMKAEASRRRDLK